VPRTNYGRQHNISESSSVSAATLTVGKHLFSCVNYKMLICHQTRSKFSNRHNRLRGSLPFHPKTQTDTVPETCCSWRTTRFPKPGFGTRLFHVGLTMDKVALGQFSSEYFVFPLVIIPSVLRIIRSSTRITDAT